MSQDFSFDITCDFDKQEFINALDQTRREITNRYDFKGVTVNIDYKESEKELVIQTDSEYKVTAIIDILESKMVKRDLPLTILDKSKEPEDAAGGTVRKRIKLIDTLTQDQVKEISKLIREKVSKVKPIVQGDSVRVTSRSKDDLQQVIQSVKEANFKLPIKFTNYR